MVIRYAIFRYLQKTWELTAPGCAQVYLVNVWCQKNSQACPLTTGPVATYDKVFLDKK